MLIGREKEVERLKNALNSERSEFIPVYGRRRVGKTFLIKETLGKKLVFFHSGLAHRNKVAQLADKEVVGNLRDTNGSVCMAEARRR